MNGSDFIIIGLAWAVILIPIISTVKTVEKIEERFETIESLLFVEEKFNKEKL